MDYVSTIARCAAGAGSRAQTRKSRTTGLTDFLSHYEECRPDSGSVARPYEAVRLKIRQTRQTKGLPIFSGAPAGRRTPNPRHLSGMARLNRTPLCPARAKPLIFSGFGTSGVGFMGPRSKID